MPAWGHDRREFTDEEILALIGNANYPLAFGQILEGLVEQHNVALPPRNAQSHIQNYRDQIQEAVHTFRLQRALKLLTDDGEIIRHTSAEWQQQYNLPNIHTPGAQAACYLTPDRMRVLLDQKDTTEREDYIDRAAADEAVRKTLLIHHDTYQRIYEEEAARIRARLTGDAATNPQPT